MAWTPCWTSSARAGALAIASPASRSRLTINCSNTRPIGEETALLSGFETPPFLFADIAGRPVDYCFARDAEHQREVLGEILAAQMAGGLTPDQITLLSPVQRSHSCLAGLTRLADCPLFDLDPGSVGRRRHALGHATIHAFKGLENTMVILHDIEHIADDKSRALLYVGMSRARERLAAVLSESCRGDYQNVVRQHPPGA